jgi:hypothetical protein
MSASSIAIATLTPENKAIYYSSNQELQGPEESFLDSGMCPCCSQDKNFCRMRPTVHQKFQQKERENKIIFEELVKNEKNMFKIRNEEN